MLGQKSFVDKPVMVSLERLVPPDDFLRQVVRVVDFSFIPLLVEERYSTIGRPSIDPIVVIKILLIGFFSGITSERRLMREIQINLSYRLFIGYNLDEILPDHSSLTKVRDRLGRETFQNIFDEIVQQCIRAGLVKGEHLSFDATLVAADASLSSMTPRLSIPQFTEEVFTNNPAEKDLSKEAKACGNEINQNSDIHLISGETSEAVKPGRGCPLSNSTHISKTDPDATLGKDRNSMMTKLSYKDNVSVDSLYRIIMDCVALSGNEDEAIDMLERLLRIKYKFGISPEEVSADKKYGTEKNFKGLEDNGIEAFIPVRKYGENSVTGLYAQDRFSYDKVNDVMICPAGQKLFPAPSLIDGKCRLFYATKNICLSCRLRDQCVRIGDRRKTGRTLSVSINREYTERAQKRLKTAKGKRAHNIRKTRVETIFGEGKTLHCLRRAKWRGLAKVHIQFLMTAVAQNIKRMVQILLPKQRAANLAALSDHFCGLSSLFKCSMSLLEQFGLAGTIQ